jgi:hypothetical protein
MTYRILKSRVAALGYDFASEVEKYIAALEAHRFSGNAAPTSYPDVEAAVARKQYPIADQKPDDFVADYEIVNDDPPPPSLAERKAAAIAALRQEEVAEIDKLFPAETRRLADLLYQQALRVKPEERSAEQQKLIADRDALNKQIEGIQLAYAQREAALANMT